MKDHCLLDTEFQFCNRERALKTGRVTAALHCILTNEPRVNSYVMCILLK
jgi:hypothetical protein